MVIMVTTMAVVDRIIDNKTVRMAVSKIVINNVKTVITVETIAIVDKIADKTVTNTRFVLSHKMLQCNNNWGFNNNNNNNLNKSRLYKSHFIREKKFKSEGYIV